MGYQLDQVRDRGESIASLWASEASIYQRFGYAVVSTQHSYEVEPRFIQWAEPLTIPERLREAFYRGDLAETLPPTSMRELFAASGIAIYVLTTDTAFAATVRGAAGGWRSPGRPPGDG